MSRYQHRDWDLCEMVRIQELNEVLKSDIF